MRFALLSLALPILISSLPLDNTDNTASLRATTDKYPAPIASGGLPSGLRDPHVVVGKQQELFLFAAKGSDIVYYSSSTGGRSWDSVGSVFSHRPPSAVEAYLRPAGKNGRLQGPSVLYSNDVYTLFYAVDTGNRLNAIFVATSKTLVPGAWKDGGLVLASTPKTDFNALSPFLVSAPDYPPYLAFGDRYNTLRMIALDEGTNKPVSEEFVNLAHCELNATIGTPAFFNVGSPFAWYLLSTFDDSTLHTKWPSQIRMARSTRSPTDPYRAKDGGLLQNGDATILLASHANVKNPSSPSAWRDQATGRWRIAYQYVDEKSRYQIGFNYLDVSSSDGWPVVIGE